VKDMGCLFQFCTSLDNISALKNWDLTNVFNVTAFFRGCVSLKDISAVSNWDLSSMTRNKSLLSVFSYCTSLKNISPLKSWDMSNINRISGLFEGCSSIKNVSALKDWDVSNITSFEFLFKNCSSLTNISALESWDISNVRSLKSMFNGCELLTDISELESWDVSDIKSMEGMFKSCDSLADVSSLNDWKVADDTNIDSLFDYCELIEDYPLWFKIRVLNDKDSNPEVRQKIIQGIDESFFRKYDLNNFDDITQLFIAQNSDNQSFLAYIVDRSKIKPVQEITLDKITDENVLADIAIHDHNYDILPSETPSSGLDFNFYFYNRENALLKIKNRDLLIKIAKESQYMPENMNYMVEYIDTEEEWIDIVLNSKSQDVRLFAFDVLESEDAFQRIIDESSDEEILAKAQEKIAVEENVSQA
jgi:surface protein